MFTVKPSENKTISWWYNQRKNIDLNPYYQRNSGLWSVKDRAFLIDSILNDYDIPKIYIADFSYINTPLNKKNKRYAVIDGKQRLESIFSFFDDDLVLDKDFEFNEDPSLNLEELSYKDLKSKYPEIAEKFDNFNLTVMSVITDEEDKINELFIRLNRGKPLVGAEIRSAMRGTIPPLIAELANHNFFKSKIKFNVNRKQDHNVVAKLLLIEFRGRFVDTKKIHLDAFVKESLLSEANYDRYAKKVEQVLDVMASVFVNKDPLLRSSGPLVIYYWLFREYPEQYQLIREFLVKFEKERRNIRNDYPDKKYQDITKYNLDIRGANDQGTISECYKILERYFKEFINKA